MAERHLIIKGARQNNLKNLDLEIPHNQLTVVTGVSGSGKSSLAFDTIFAEGQRLYIESLSTYARQFLERAQRPDVDLIKNISPTIAIEQKNTVKNSRSTVGTSTEIYDYLRLLFAKIGKIQCPHCHIPIKKDTISNIVDFTLQKCADQKILVLAPFSLEKINHPLLIKTLIKKGFTRAFLNHTIVDLVSSQAPETSLGKSQELFIVLDRLVVKESIRPQLTDSLEIAYQEARGRALIYDEKEKFHKFSIYLRCSQCDLRFPELLPSFFSFNNPYGACGHCNGFGNNLIIDEELVVPNQNVSLEQGAIDPWTKPSLKRWHKRLLEFAQKEKIPTQAPYKDLGAEGRKKIFEGTKGFKGVLGFFKQLERKKYKMAIRVFLSRYKSAFTCPKCQGKRLRPEIDFVKIKDKTIADILSKKFFNTLELAPYEESVSKEVLRQIKSRLSFLDKVGVEYLTLDRLTKTLSGGEAQRINLANQLGAALMQTTYVLDEPSIGLHPRDNKRLIELLKSLRDLGNTVIVVEHDPDIISQADTIIELGPEGGEKGGNLLYQGSFKEFLKQTTLTASYLTQKELIPIPHTRRKGSGHIVKLSGVT
ncbi:MAG: excinuclease ABC subunit A, partial [Deltaproteobacteria bacterium]|nr:excinuclease ABC subunit A [Deltaproteobacteria bacterium]